MKKRSMMAKGKRLTALILALAMAGVLTAGCGKTVPAAKEKNRSVMLSDGYEVKGLPDKIDRIAALFGPSYERLYVLNAEDKIVDCSDFHKSAWPWSHLIYKRVDSADVHEVKNASKGLNVEEIAGQDLDVVFYWRNEEVLKALDNVGLAAVPYNTNGGTDSIKQELNAYAQVLNTDEAKTINSSYADYFDRKLAAVKEVTDKIPDSEKKTVYYSRSKLLTTFGKDSDIIDVCRDAGGKPVTENLPGSSSVDTDREQLTAWNPDFIFIDHTDNAQGEVDKLLSDADYSGLNAVKNRNAYAVPVGTFYWDAGVQMILLVEWMAKTMYPDRFPDLDMKAELKDFYKQFYRFDLTDEQAEMILSNENPSSAK